MCVAPRWQGVAARLCGRTEGGEITIDVSAMHGGRVGSYDVRAVWSTGFGDDTFECARVDRDTRCGGLWDDVRLRHGRISSVARIRRLSGQERVQDVQ